MGEREFSGGLTALAEHAERTGRLAGAADLRTRADRRRRLRYVGSAGAGLAVAAAFTVGIALGQPRATNEHPVVPQAPAASQPRAESPTASASSASPAVPSSPGLLPPGVPRSPIKAPPPEYPYTATPAPPPTANRTR